jgi:uncharacterized protein (DUF924 family)
MTIYDQIIDFWVTEVGPNNWYNGPPELDETIRERFMSDWNVAYNDGYKDWIENANGCLGYLILTDQFPRNMFRDDARAFATDPLALSAATLAIENDFDLQFTGPERQFFYMPFEHSEDSAIQELSVKHISERMPDAPGQLLHAKVHQEIIYMFGRFPYRNNALGRDTTADEQSFINNGGYQSIVKKLQNQT